MLCCNWYKRKCVYYRVFMIIESNLRINCVYEGYFVNRVNIVKVLMVGYVMFGRCMIGGRCICFYVLF